MEKPSSVSSSNDLKKVDWISKLPNDVLLMILSRLSTEEAVRTSLVSKRWEHVWKYMNHLVLDMRKLIKSKDHSIDVSNRVATLMTKVINSHDGHLKSCEIEHYTYQGEDDGMLNTWIRSLTCVKHTKVLTLKHHYVSWDLMDVKKFLQFPPNSFSHASLKSLSLSQYRLYTSHPFNNCQNLKTLKLLSIFAPEVEVFNKTLASCPSLEVLVLDITCLNKGGGHLRIDHNKLKLLHVMFMDGIDSLNVSATSLDILAISYTSFRRDGFVLTTPQLQFNRNFWVAGGYVPHVSYNISKEDKSIAHQEFVNDNISFEFLRPVTFAAPSMSVSVDLKNRTDVERLRHVLRLWNRQMLELEIVFKKNNDTTREEGEKKENIKNEPFPNAKFRVETVWLHNFSGSKEEYALASCFIKYETVVRRMMIKTTSFPKRKKLKIETAVAKLRALLTKDQWKLTIKCF